MHEPPELQQGCMSHAARGSLHLSAATADGDTCTPDFNVLQRHRVSVQGQTPSLRYLQ